MLIKNYFMTIATLARSHTWLLLERVLCLFSLSCDIAPRTPTKFKKSPRVFFKVVIFISLSPFPWYQLFLFPTNFLSFPFPVIPPKTIPRQACIVLFVQNSTLFLLSSNARDIEFSQLILFYFLFLYNLFSQQNIIVADIIFIYTTIIITFYGTLIINFHLNKFE